MIPKTYCHFISEGRPDRKGVLQEHPKSQDLRGRFRHLAAIYFGIWGWRVWTVDRKRKIIFDTGKGDWVHPEVRKVQKSKDPALLIGHLKSDHGKAALETKLKEGVYHAPKN